MIQAETQSMAKSRAAILQWVPPKWEDREIRDRAKHCFCLVFVLFFVLFLLVWVVLVVVLVLLGVVLELVEVVASHYCY